MSSTKSTDGFAMDNDKNDFKIKNTFYKDSIESSRMGATGDHLNKNNNNEMDIDDETQFLSEISFEFDNDYKKNLFDADELPIFSIKSLSPTNRSISPIDNLSLSNLSMSPLDPLLSDEESNDNECYLAKFEVSDDRISLEEIHAQIGTPNRPNQLKRLNLETIVEGQILETPPKAKKLLALKSSSANSWRISTHDRENADEGAACLLVNGEQSSPEDIVAKYIEDQQKYYHLGDRGSDEESDFNNFYDNFDGRCEKLLDNFSTKINLND